MIEVFTKKRLEMINKIKPKSIQELATILQRKKQAVDRDIKILERFDIIELKKEGRNVIPIIKRKILVLPLVKGLEISNPEKKEYAVA
jgi:predicted transcriptional regulator